MLQKLQSSAERLGSVVMKLYEPHQFFDLLRLTLPIQVLAFAMYTRILESGEAKRQGMVTRYVLYCWISGAPASLAFLSQFINVSAV